MPELVKGVSARTGGASLELADVVVPHLAADEAVVAVQAAVTP